MNDSPTFVAEFADGEVTQMTTFTLLKNAAAELPFDGTADFSRSLDDCYAGHPRARRGGRQRMGAVSHSIPTMTSGTTSAVAAP